jgi:histidyl-tRNA synthetase
MGPLDERQRREDAQFGRAREHLEKGWDAFLQRDAETAADLFELAAADLRAVNKNKVVPIRGPKG